MATFAYENAKLSEVFLRRQLPNGDQKYLRLPFNIVCYDDGSGEYVEPIPALGNGGAAQQFTALYTEANDPGQLIVDRPPYNETIQIL